MQGVSYDFVDTIALSKTPFKLFQNSSRFPLLVMIKPCVQERPDRTGCAVAGNWMLPLLHPLYGHITPPDYWCQFNYDSRLIAGVRWIVFDTQPSFTIVTPRDIANNFAYFPRKMYEGYSCNDLNAHSYFEVARQVDGTLHCDTKER
jgi:hypothetical protein